MDAEPSHALLRRAAELALGWHAGQTRKGRDIPYASHLLQVAGLVLEHGGDAEQAAAGLLHDALEDAATPAERTDREAEIRGRCGPEVLALVLDATDTGPREAGEQKAPWPERKRRYLEQLGGVGPRGALVVACDKRHNLGSLVSDLREEGPRTFERFRAGGPEQLAYFRGVLAALCGRIPGRLEAELAALLDEFGALLGPPLPSAGEQR